MTSLTARAEQALKWCGTCRRYMFCTRHSPFLWKCEECCCFVPEEIG